MTGDGARARLRTLRFGLATLLGRRPRGFFLPYRYAASTVPPQHYPELESLFRAAEPAFLGVLDEIDAHAAVLTAIGVAPPPAPRWDQDWFPRLDAAAAYALIRRHLPERIVEVGSGHSTRFMARAVADAGLHTQIVAIDPAPRAAIDGLGLDLRRCTLQQALDGADEIFRFGARDVLFVDSSHLLVAGSDVDLLLNRVVPRLPTGALLHVHDVFLPDGYPAGWGWRGYNEQNAIGPLLAHDAFELLFASHWTATRLAARIDRSVLARLPLPAGAWETSLWLRRR